MVKLFNRLIKLTERLRSVLSNSIPAYSCRKSRKTYKQPHLAVIWCLMKKLRTNYRGIIELLELMPRVMQTIGLERLPHFTTVNKFFLRTCTASLYGVLIRTACLFPDRPRISAADSTGYSGSHASRHYLWRIGLGSYTKRRHVKLSISICTDAQYIMAAKARLGPRNDNIDFPRLVRDSARLRPEYMVADKGYDSEANHELARGLGIKPVIPLKGNKYGTVRKRYRRRMLKEFDKDVYSRRSLVETVNSSMKRIMGSHVNSRSAIQQRKELIGMCIVYNVHRYLSVSLTYWMISTEP